MRFLRFGTQSWQNYWVSTTNSWKENIEWFAQFSQYRELDCIDGEPVQFEWKKFPGHKKMQLLRETQRTMEDNTILHEKSEDRKIFMSMCNDIDWRKSKKKTKFVCWILQCRCVHRKTSHSTLSIRRTRIWRKVARNAHLQTERFGEPCCRPDDGQSQRKRTSYIPSSRLSRGPLKSKGSENTSKHCNGDPATAQLLFRMLISVNQPSHYGEELAQQISDHSSSSTGKPVAKMNDESESKVALPVMSILTSSALINVPVQGTLVRQHNERFENLPEDIRARKAGADAVFCGKVSPGQYFVNSWHLNWQDSDVLVHVENIRLLEMMKIKAERMESRRYKNWPSEEVKITNYMERVGIEIKIDSMQKDGSPSWTVISRGINLSFQRRTRTPPRRSGSHCAETRCDRTSGTSQTIIIFMFPMETPSRTRRRWPEYYEIKAFIEKMMEQWKGKDCVIILTHQNGRIATRKDFSIAWTLTASFSTCVLSKSLGRKRSWSFIAGYVEIPYNWIEYMYHTGSFHHCRSILQQGLIAVGKETKEERQTVFFTAVDPTNEPQDEPYDVPQPRQVPYRLNGKCFGKHFFGSI